jgi:hypothetical protein
VNERQVYFIGGSCGLLIGIAYVIIIALYVSAGAPPIGGDALLAYLAAHARKWWWIIGLSVLTDFLFIPFSASIYFVFKKLDRYLIWLATGCMVLFVVLDLAITWTNYVAEMALSTRYLKAVTDLEKSAILIAAEPVIVLLRSKLLFVYNSLTLSAGILLSSLVMLRSNFPKGTSYLGIVTGFAGALAVFTSFLTSTLSIAIIIASCLTTVWVMLLGYQFCRRGTMASIKLPV